jgi:DNA-binding Lrp family transcriptional regulator
MDEKDRLLLICLQNGLPLTRRPFDVWSAKIGADSAELLVRIQRLTKERVLGGIKAVLDPRAFHYQSAWVAAKVRPEDLKSGTEVFWQHPGVVYSCEREHEFNVWFFIAVPAGHDLELHVRCLEKISGAQRTLFMPVKKVLKGSDFSSSVDEGAFFAMDERFKMPKTGGSFDLTDEEIVMIRKLQEPFPLTDEPYQKIAAELGITEAQALEQIKALSVKGCLKRIGSFSKSSANFASSRALVVWQIPEEKIERIGPEIVGCEDVLCADLRPAFPEFPYSLYTMVRAGTPPELEATMRRMQDRIGKWPCRELVITREFKKERVNYFPKGLDVWWRASRHEVETAFH